MIEKTTEEISLGNLVYHLPDDMKKQFAILQEEIADDVVWVRKDEIQKELCGVLERLKYDCVFFANDNSMSKSMSLFTLEGNIECELQRYIDCPHVPDNSEPLGYLNSGNSQQSVGVKSSSEEPETLIVEAGVGVTPAKVGEGSIPSASAEALIIKKVF